MFLKNCRSRTIFSYFNYLETCRPGRYWRFYPLTYSRIRDCVFSLLGSIASVQISDRISQMVSNFSMSFRRACLSPAPMIKWYRNGLLLDSLFHYPMKNLGSLAFYPMCCFDRQTVWIIIIRGVVFAFLAIIPSHRSILLSITFVYWKISSVVVAKKILF